MTPKFDIYKFIKQHLPPSKRKLEKFYHYLRGLLSQSYRTNSIFENLLYGFESDFYDSSATYNKGDRTVYKYQVYESLTDSNTGNSPDSSPTAWLLINDIFIGIRERERYVSQKIVLEFAINHYFRKELNDNGFTGFIQPDDSINPTKSDIYIENYIPTFTSIVSFTTEVGSSGSYTTGSGFSGSFTTEITAGQNPYRFSVYIPSAVYSDINSNASIAEKIVREFLDKYIPAGIVYDITTY